jgi:hypothetical protein
MGWKNWSYASKGGLISLGLSLFLCVILWIYFRFYLTPLMCQKAGIADCSFKYSQIGAPQGGIFFWLLLILVLAAFYLPGYILGGIIDNSRKK